MVSAIRWCSVAKDAIDDDVFVRVDVALDQQGIGAQQQEWGVVLMPLTAAPDGLGQLGGEAMRDSSRFRPIFPCCRKLGRGRPLQPVRQNATASADASLS